MPIILSHESALSLWRRPEVRPLRMLDAHEAWRLLQKTGQAAHVDVLRNVLKRPVIESLPLPLHLLSAQRNARRITRRAHLHCMQATFPEGSFVLMDTYSLDTGCAVQIVASSPELCFVQMAQSLSMYDLVALGYELCGRYSVAPNARRGFLERMLRSTPKKLADFAHAASNMTGAKRARAATRWLLPEASSPEESKLCMIAHMPRSQGGMGTKPPILGATLEAPDPAARILGARYFTPALYWPDARVAIEFSTRTWSTPEERANYNKLVRNAYRTMGISAILLGRDDLRDANELRKHFDFVNRKCKHRLQAPSAKLLARQQELVDWAASH